MFASKLTSPPYRMPPQPGLCGEVPIPGAASDPPLRTHSSKFPVNIYFIFAHFTIKKSIYECRHFRQLLGVNRQ